MKFVYEPALLEYMKKKGSDTIIVEMVEINSSDFDVAELYVRLADQRQSEFFRTKKNYRSVETEHGTVLLPRFPLEMAETVTFGLKSVLFFKYMTYTGIKI